MEAQTQQTVAVDANEVIEKLLDRIKQLELDNAILLVRFDHTCDIEVQP